MLNIDGFTGTLFGGILRFTGEGTGSVAESSREVGQ